MDTSQLPGRGIKPLLSLRKHYRVSMVIWLVVILIGLPVAWIKGQSFYGAEAIFQVSPNYMKNLSSDKEIEFQSNTQYREFVNHLSNTVTRYDVVQRALNKLAQEEKIDVKPKGQTERKFIERLQKTVYVRAIPDTYMVRIGMEGDTKATLANLVNAITNSFLETTKNEQLFGSVERVQVLEGTSARLRKEIDDLEARRVEFSKLLGLTTFGENVTNPYDSMLVQAREKSTIATIERTHAEATLQAFLTQRETPTSIGRSIMEMRLQDNGLQALRNEVVKRSEEITRTIDGLEDKHPAKKPALAEYEAINKRLQVKEAEFEKAAFENVRNRLAASLNQAKQIEDAIRLSLKSVEGQAADYAKNFQQAMRLTSDVRKREQELKEVRDRLNYLQNERSAIGFVRLVMPALPAETPQGIGKVKLLLIVFVVAAVLGFLAPTIIDLMDRRIQTVNEAEKLIGIPAAGWQVDVQDYPTQLFAREQSRRFASTLIRNKARSGRHVFAFTSVKTEGGTTSVILDTAVVLQQLGVSVLVVDANSFASNPAFGTLTPTLSDFLRKQADIGQIVHPFTHQEVALQVVGFGSDTTSGIQRLDLLKAAVQQWTAEYEFVLIDLPPILMSADTELLIEVFGDVFMVLDGQSVTKGEISRAKRLLQKLDPEAVGLFVNRVPMFRGGGYMQELMVETLTKKKFSQFMSLSELKLNIEIFRAGRAQERMEKKKEKAAEKAAKQEAKSKK